MPGASPADFAGQTDVGNHLLFTCAVPTTLTSGGSSQEIADSTRRLGGSGSGNLWGCYRTDVALGVLQFGDPNSARLWRTAAVELERALKAFGEQTLTVAEWQSRR